MSLRMRQQLLEMGNEIFFGILRYQLFEVASFLPSPLPYLQYGNKCLPNNVLGRETPPGTTVTYKQLKERGFKGTKYDAEIMIAQGITLQDNSNIPVQNSQPFLGNLAYEF